MTEFAILAAGEGSRLKQEGLSTPKPLLPLFGTPMIERLIRIFAGQGARHVHVIINRQSQALYSYLDGADFGIPIFISMQDTPSSLHSLQALVVENPSWESCIVTTTDTVFGAVDFAGYCAGFLSHPACDVYMGVTSFVDDESPLFVLTDNQMNILDFSDTGDSIGQYVSGGIYGLRKKALDMVSVSVAEGEHRMRNYQRCLLAGGLDVKAHLLGKVVDVDHLQDRDVAEKFLKEMGEMPL